MCKLALYGAPGAGKSTASALLQDAFAAREVPALVLKIGEPLYQIQRLIYTIAGRSLAEPYRQDGELLNFLGAHLRRIQPDFLTDDFALRVRDVTSERPGAALICDDLRAPDLAAVAALGFRTIRVAAPEGVRAARHRARDDLSRGTTEHPTESPVPGEADFTLTNDGDLATLSKRVAELVDEVMSHRPVAGVTR